MNSFEETINLMALYLTQVEGTLILIGVTEDTVLRDHAIESLRNRLEGKIAIRDFRFDNNHISLLEGALKVANSTNEPVVVSVTGLESLRRDKQSEAIKLLNFQRNRFGRSNLAVILWVNQALLAEIAAKAADFYSWRRDTFLLEPPPDWKNLESERQSYLQALYDRSQFVNLQGLAPMRGGQVVQMKMDEIFIPLRADQEVTLTSAEPFLHPYDNPVKKSKKAPEVEGDRHSIKESKAAPSRTVFAGIARREVKSRSVELDELFREKRVIVLGDPGAGKTTLLRYLAYRLAQAQLQPVESDFIKQNPQLAKCLPVYVRIGLYAQYLQQNPEATLDEYAPIGSQALQIPLSFDLLKAEMAKGRILFLLDGLDEIIDTTQRRDVARRVEEFARGCAKCSIIVTSRIVGYNQSKLGSDFSEVVVRKFEEPEIRRFAESWYRAFGEPQSADSLIRSIFQNDSIRNLASNPLLLTVIALIHHRRTKLPHRRSNLYRLAAETLVDQWMSERRVMPEGWDVQETLNVLLPAIAWHLHQTTSSGLIGEQELHALLVRTMRLRDSRLSETEAHTRAAQFRRNVNEFSGIFLERGTDEDGRGLYGFLHLTFEEYFAAVTLCEMWDRQGSKVLKPLLHNPRWNEILLLAAGRFSEFSQVQATRLVRTIFEARSPYEEILRRDMLMAARCLADDIRVEGKLQKQLLKVLFQHYFANDSAEGLRLDIGKAFAQMVGSSSEEELIATLLNHLTGVDGSKQIASARALGQMRLATPQVLEPLFLALSDNRWNVCYEAAIAIGQIGKATNTTEIVDRLAILLSENRIYYRTAAVYALGVMGEAAATPKVIAALQSMLSDSNWNLQNAAANALGQMGEAAATSKVIASLCKLISNSKQNQSYDAAHALALLGKTSARNKILARLVRLISHPDMTTRYLAVGTFELMEQSAATAKVLAALETAFSDSNKYVQIAAALSIWKIKKGKEVSKIIPFLLKMLSNGDWNARYLAANAFGQIGQEAALPKVIAALEKRLADSQAYVRDTAIMAIGQMGQATATPQMISLLAKHLADSETTVRDTTVTALDNLSGYARPQHRSRLINRFWRLATSKRNKHRRDAGYLGLRNLLATESPDAV
jgi:HEAT repeat protein